MAVTWSDQQQAALTARGNVLVSAGAGSGKTTVLVERLAQRVLDPAGPDLDQLLVVTFTEAAAAEMRNRIGERLEAARAAAVAQADQAAARRADRQLALLERAQISTLHSFCLEVVRRNFLTLGIEPVFHLLGDEDRRLLRQQVFNAVLEEQLSGPAAESLAQMLQQLCQGEPEQLANLVDRLDVFSRSQPWPESWLAEVAAAYRRADGALAQWPWTPAFLQWLELQLAAARGQLAAVLREAAAVPELSAYADDAAAGLQCLEEALTTLAAARAGLPSLGRGGAEGPDLAAAALKAGAGSLGNPDSVAAALAAVAAGLGAWLQQKGSPRAPANPAWDGVKKQRKRVRDQLGELWTLLSR
ncbi:MAG: UvrD-helicase domain-containing protein, partial [Alicyclobacillus sp.]|nr:UvrD-helicase domain-containing protein [Alicyclobacillus sp.]